MIRDFALERFLAKHEFAVKHLACASDPESMRVADLLALEPGTREALEQLWLGYTETRGAQPLREAIAALDPGLAPEQVVVCVGAQEPIALFAQATLKPGDHAVVLTPTYQSLHELARGTGATVSEWQLREEDGWQPDVAELERLITPNTKALIVNTPNNPTGALLTRDRFDAVVTIARRHGLWLFCDEVYRGLERASAHRLPLASLAYERAVSLGAMAKVYGLAGLRIGWVSSRDSALLDKLVALKDYASICAAGPSELLATVALRHADMLRQRSLALVTQNEAAFAAALQGTELSWVSPSAGTTGFVRVPESAQRWSARLLNDTGVLLAPSTLFDWGDAHVRVGLGRAQFPAALEALRRWLETQ